MIIGFSIDENTSLLDLIGSDLWVKCWDRYNKWVMYIHPLDYEKDYLGRIILRYSQIPDFFIDEHTLEMLTKEEALESVQEEFYAQLNYFDIISPVDTATTDEIIDIINECNGTPFGER